MFENLDINFCKLLKRSEYFRSQMACEYVGTEHLLLSILESEKLKKLLDTFNLNFDNFYEETKNCICASKKSYPNCFTPLLKKIINKCQKDNNFNEKNVLFNILDEGEGVAIRLLINLNVDIDKLYNALIYSNKEKTELAIYKYGKILSDYINLNDKVIGRDKEIELVIETLLRKKKNNPLLIGNPGVGKTAIIEELARRIVLGNVPKELLNMKIVMLDMGNLVSGTRYRGEFEEKLNLIINELLENKNIIVFIDEIHTMINAGAAEGAISASDILKPYLARGDIKCIGTTTQKEYEKFFLKDGALTRRFETIYVFEPTVEQTFDILKKVKKEYEDFHKVMMTDKDLKILINLADKYFPNKKNPDKSLELLDSVLSYVRSKKGNCKIQQMENLLKKYEIEKVKNIEAGDFKQALKFNIELNNVKQQINHIKNCFATHASKEDILDVLEFKNSIIINKNINKTINAKLHKYIKNQCKPLLFVSSDSITKIKDFAEQINYKCIMLSKTEDIVKIINEVKYCPSTLIICSNIDNYDIVQFLKKITKDYLIEHNDEYVSFNNSIVFVKDKMNSIGFNSDYQCDFVIDEVLS